MQVVKMPVFNSDIDLYAQELINCAQNTKLQIYVKRNFQCVKMIYKFYKVFKESAIKTLWSLDNW